MEKTEVLIVGEHLMIREALAMILNSDPDFMFSSISSGFGNARTMMIAQMPAIIVINATLPFEPANDLMKTISAGPIKSKMILVSEFKSSGYVDNLIRIGVFGFVSNSSGIRDLKEAMITVQRGEKFICSEVKDALTESFISSGPQINQLSLLSPKEIEILELTKIGLSARETAKRLSLSHRTIEVHRYNIMKKLKVRKVASLVNMANSYGI